MKHLTAVAVMMMSLIVGCTGPSGLTGRMVDKMSIDYLPCPTCRVILDNGNQVVHNGNTVTLEKDLANHCFKLIVVNGEGKTVASSEVICNLSERKGPDNLYLVAMDLDTTRVRDVDGEKEPEGTRIKP